MEAESLVEFDDGDYITAATVIIVSLRGTGCRALVWGILPF